MKFRVGDVVSLEGAVVGTQGPTTYIVDVAEGHHDGRASLMMKEDQLKLVKAGPPAPGDTVIYQDNEALTYTVLAVHEEVAWIKRSGQGYLSALIKNLVVVERA